MKQFADKRVAVTGGALGIGRAVVEAFAAQGAAVVFADIDEEAGRRTELEVCAKVGSKSVWYVNADLSDENAVARFTGTVLDTFRGVDVLVNNVGINLKRGDIVAHTVQDFENTLRLNMYSAIHCIRAFLPAMLEAGKGAIVNVSSTMALGAKGYSAYSLSKSSLISLTKTLALDHAADHIRVNAVAPGAILTPATSAWAHATANPAAEKGIPMGRLGTAEEVAEAVLFLASDRASYITGHVLTVDGGMTVGE